MLHLTGLNHSIVATRDLEAAQNAFAGLGFRLTPRGVHPGRGTANYCIMFANSNYIELLGACETGNVDAEPLLAEKLRSGEGIAAVAFDSDDGEALWHELVGVGITATRPKIAQRDFEHAGRRRTVRFEILRLPREATPELNAFICRHLNPALVYQSRFCDHANTARIVRAVTLLVDNPGAVRSAYEALFGQPQGSDARWSFATGNCLLQFATEPWIRRNLWSDAAAGACPAALLTIRCGDLRHAAALAAAAGFGVQARDGRWLVQSTDRTCGVGLIYEDAAG